MQPSTVAKILAEIETLSPDEQAELRAAINPSLSRNGSLAGLNGKPVYVYAVKPESNSAFDSTLSRQWLEQNGLMYTGQYVALDGDRLIAHGPDGSAVAKAVRESGVKTFFFTFIPPADALPYVGF
jgi:hypothetical protein